MAQNFYMPITSSNINRFLKFFYWWNQQKMCSKLTLKIPPHLIGVVTLPCEMSDIALKPVTTVINCVINVAQAWHVASKHGELFHRWFVNVDNSWQFWSTEWGKLLQRLINRAIGQWRRWLECIVQQQGGHIEHLMWELRVTLNNNSDNKQAVLLLFL